MTEPIVVAIPQESKTIYTIPININGQVINIPVTSKSQTGIMQVGEGLTVTVDGLVSVGGDGALVFKGYWNADSNTPNLNTIDKNSGDFWICNVAGTTDLDGETPWLVDDWAIFLDGVWFK